MVILKRLGVWSVAKFQAIMMAIIGLILGIIFALLGSLMAISFPAGAIVPAGGMFAGLGFLMIIIFPILYGIMGLVGGAIGALIFNQVSKIIGGIEMDFEE